MEGTMKTAVMTGIGEVEIQQRPIPSPAAGEVLVKVEYVGICGSDLHYYESGRIGDYIVEPPFVLGHEAGGTVVELGEGVTHLKVGDKVAMEPGKTCGTCEYCKAGKYNLCEDVIFFATPPVDGVFQEYVAHEAGLCFKLPENMSSMEGALIEPLAVGLHAANQGGAQLGQTAVVTGADLGIETAGSQITATQLIKAAKKGSTIVFVGYSASGEMTLPVGLALDKELNFKTVFRYRNSYPMAIQAVSSGKIAIKEIVTDYFELDDIKNALDSCVHNKADIVKGVIKIS